MRPRLSLPAQGVGAGALTFPELGTNLVTALTVEED